jgi:hypothetical protein
MVKTLRKRIVLFVRDVLVGLLKQLFCAVQPSGMVHSGVHRRVIVQVLAIINRGPLDFINRFVNLVNGFLLLFLERPTVLVLQLSAGGAQVRQRMKISPR